MGTFVLHTDIELNKAKSIKLFLTLMLETGNPFERLAWRLV